MKVTFSERYVLLQVCPRTGNLETAEMIEAFLKALPATSAEVKQYSVVIGREQIGWPPEFDDTQFEIEVAPVLFGLIVKNLKELEKAEKLHVSFLQVYRRFMKLDAEMSATLNGSKELVNA